VEDEREDHTHTGFHANMFAGPQAKARHHSLNFTKSGLLYLKPGVEHTVTHPHATLDWKIESPPVIFHGDTENSTGAIISGQLFLDVKQLPFEVESIEAKLEVKTNHKRPFHANCSACADWTTELKKWKFVTEPTALAKRKCQPRETNLRYKVIVLTMLLL
jgi:arrestin-related trafficking adapter 1